MKARTLGICIYFIVMLFGMKYLVINSMPFEGLTLMTLAAIGTDLVTFKHRKEE